MMGSMLDLDDVAGEHPEARRQLLELRAQLDAALDVVVDLGGEVRLPEIEEAKQRRKDAERWRQIEQDFSPMGLDANGQHVWMYRRNGSLKGPTLGEAVDAAMATLPHQAA